MEETEHLDWGGTRHPLLNRVTTWLTGALVGAVVVLVLDLLTDSAIVHRPAPVVHRITATSCAVVKCQLMHEREGVDLGPRNDGCR